MIIGLDYDDTYTRDPVTWRTAMGLFKANGHTVYGVTFRHGTGQEFDTVDKSFFDVCDAVYFTGRSPKRTFMLNEGVHINVWIDDAPDLIVGGLTPHKIEHADEEIISVLHTGSVNEGINWDTLWHIKNGHWGPEAEAIELYPAASRLVNNAPVRHLWRVPENVPLPDLEGGWPE